MENNTLQHHGVLGMKWGIRRYQPYSTVPRQSGKGGKEIGEAIKTKRSKIVKAVGVTAIIAGVGAIAVSALTGDLQYNVKKAIERGKMVYEHCAYTPFKGVRRGVQRHYLTVDSNTVVGEHYRRLNMMRGHGYQYKTPGYITRSWYKNKGKDTLSNLYNYARTGNDPWGSKSDKIGMESLALYSFADKRRKRG